MADSKKTTFSQEFRTFIARGNVIDLAVGIIIGSAFTGIVNSLVKDVILPPIGMIMGKVNFSELKIVLQAKTEASPEVAVLYGSLIQNIINFLLVALVVFSLIKAINTVQKTVIPEQEKTAKKKETELSLLKAINKNIKALKK